MRPCLLALSLSALLLVGCGGDDGDTASVETTAAPDTSVAAETTVPADDTVADDTEGVCSQLAELADIDPDALPTQEDIDRVAAVAETAPPEIQASLVTIAEVGQLIADTGDAALTDPDVLAELEAATTSPEVTAAGEALVAYSADQCGIEVPLFSSFTG